MFLSDFFVDWRPGWPTGLKWLTKLSFVSSLKGYSNIQLFCFSASFDIYPTFHTPGTSSLFLILRPIRLIESLNLDIPLHGRLPTDAHRDGTGE